MCDKQFSVILAAKLLTGQKVGEPLRDFLLTVAEIEHYVALYLEIKKVQEEEFSKTVLTEMFVDLSAVFSAEVKRNQKQLKDSAWQYAQGDWNAVVRLATEFDRELGVSNNQTRLVTQQIVEQVFERLLPQEEV